MLKPNTVGELELSKKRDRYHNDPEYRKRVSDYSRAYNKRVRSEMLDVYGRKCSCCSEDNVVFLTLDHLRGSSDGVPVNHGFYSRPSRGIGEYLRLRKLGWPKDGYRILCMNCNFAIGIYGYCPHNKQVNGCSNS